MTCVTEAEATAQGIRLPFAANDTGSDDRCEEGRNDDGLVDDLDDIDEDWRPPTNEERQKIQERLDERDRVSQLMASKMLSGWAMLNQHCITCVSQPALFPY